MRKCGDCKACCVLLPVRVLDKPANVPCKHLCASGCGIYPNWPDLCNRWECAWRSGELGPYDRPDKSGVIIWSRELDGSQVICANSKPGKKIKPKVWRWLMERQLPVLHTQGSVVQFYVNGQLRDEWPADEPRALRLSA